MNNSSPRRSTRFALTLGLMAFVGGLWLFLDSQEVGLLQAHKWFLITRIILGLFSKFKKLSTETLMTRLISRV